MKVRKRLLVGSLAVSAVASVAIGFAVARSNDSQPGTPDDVAALDTGSSLEPPTIGTNAVVQGTPLPQVTVQTLQGDDLSTADLLGRPMVINVWGSTCGPCKKELPDFAAVHAVYGDDVRFVGIDFLPPSDREEQFARDRGIQYELLYDTAGEFTSEVGIAAFPVTLLVLADGTIVEQTGQLDQAKLTALIEEHLL